MAEAVQVTGELIAAVTTALEATTTVLAVMAAPHTLDCVRQ
jgi:hypothetical protein